jgi:outer membrane autotransporter protein
LAGLAAANLGNDLMQGRGLGALLAATQQTAGFSAFGAMEGIDQRIDTGSHIDLTGFSMVAGVGRGIEVGTSRLTLGAFFETGVGSYDAYNSFATGSVEADGDSDYYGGGLGGRYDTASGLYAVASIRFGHSTTDYESGDITYQGQHAGFETSATYYGGQAGIGYLWRPASDKVLDLYSKWLWTHLGSDEVSVLGDPVQFKSADSHRWRTGGRFEAKMRERFSPYAGLAYEYEFDGDSEATAYGLNIDTPSLKGSTGIGEAGVRVDNLFNAGQLSLDLGVQGYVGQREGIGATGSLKWVF